MGLEPVTVTLIDDQEEAERFDRAARAQLGISGDEFAARLDSRDIGGLSRSAAMRVALLRPTA